MILTVRAFVVVVTALLVQAFALPGQQSMLDAEIQGLVQLVNRASDPQNRYLLAREISGSVVSDKTRDVSPQTISQLTDLLRDRDDVVRFWAATALGNIGTLAITAVPALERALQEAAGKYTNSIPPSLYSADAINGALEKLTGRPSRP